MDIVAPFRITIAGLDELASVGTARPTHVLSILDPAWPTPEVFGSYGEHAKLELRFNDVIEADTAESPPEAEHVAALLAFGRDLAAEPADSAHLLVHCHAGISRSTAATTLILAQALPGHPADEILAHVLRIRDKAWPNLRLLELGDAAIGRGGTLPAAAHALYRHQVERRPFLYEFMRNAGRERELATVIKPTVEAN